ncbi:DNA gyrase/topoisomerase IV subunit A [Persicimonas caeni]|nr:DNA topoisomerase IV subunit A [Persicimonas caeni]
MAAKIEKIPLHETAQARYLNYAMSVITSRALPDVRDGLKPVQRRILYAMFSNLRLTHDAKHMKSARIVGEVMGKYHPHGDQSIYDAMVRMAQDFSVRYPLVDGHGNFGSLDGDSAAAMRYTEARLTNLSSELLDEIKKSTVDFRPNYDGTEAEPGVLPSQVPNLLINGATGIAVGMATNIPPHNLGECLDALIALIDDPSLEVDDLVDKYIKGPDFPTGGVMLNTVEELQEIYREGSGTINMRASWEVESRDYKKFIIIKSLPYTVNKATLVEKIADHIIQGNLPQVQDVRDESTADVRVVLELKRGTDPETAMAYLFKHTPLEHRFHVNVTCLVPQEQTDPLTANAELREMVEKLTVEPWTKRKEGKVRVIDLLDFLREFEVGEENPSVPTPATLDLKQMLAQFRDFRMEVLVRRLLFELEKILGRIHILEAFELIFNDLDKAIELIRASESKKNAADKLMNYFGIDADQADAILETKLYRLAKLEIENIREELAARREEAEKIQVLLLSEEKRWEFIRNEFVALRDVYSDPRRTKVDVNVAQLEYSEADYILDEDVWVMVTKDGWFKRQKSYSDLSTIRVRDNDEIGWVMPGRTPECVLFFSNMGRVYTMRIDDVPSTTGYGDPVQAYFDFDDGEKIVGVITIDKRVLQSVAPDQPSLVEDSEVEDGEPQMIAITRQGQGVRFTLEGFDEPSTVKGRMFMRLSKKDEVVNVEQCTCHEEELVTIASREGRGLTFHSREVSQYKGAAKGVKTIGLEGDDEVLDWTLSTGYYEGLEVETNRGRNIIISRSKSKFEPTSRGNKGRWVIKRGHLIRSYRPPVEIQKGEEDDGSEEE